MKVYKTQIWISLNVITKFKKKQWSVTESETTIDETQYGSDLDAEELTKMS